MSFLSAAWSPSNSPNSVAELKKLNPDLSGYLTKQGGMVKNWKKRYFILKDDKLYYFKTERDKAPQGIVELHNTSVQTARSLTNKSNSIELKARGRAYYLVANSKAEQKKWMIALSRGANVRGSSTPDKKGTGSPLASDAKRASKWGITASLSDTLHLTSPKKEKTQKMEQPKQKIFGEKLSVLKSIEGSEVPKLIQQLISNLENNGIDQIGLFRVSGVSSEKQEIIDIVENGETPKWENYSPHSLASLLKLYLHQLPEKIITYSANEEYINIKPGEEKEELKKFINGSSLPQQHVIILKYLMKFLVQVKDNPKNQMDGVSLAAIFCILLSPSLDLPENMAELYQNCLCMIEHYNDIFV